MSARSEMSLSWAQWMCRWHVWALLLLAVPYAAATTQPVDSAQAGRKRLAANSTLEKVVSFPGQLAYAPVRYTVLGLGYAGVYLVQTGVVDKIVSVVGGAGFTPVYAPRTGAGLRFTRLDCLTKGAALITTASSWLDGRQLYSVEWSDVPLGTALTTEYSIRYRSLTAEAFYGVGPEAATDDKVVYSEEDVLFEFSIAKRLNRFFRAKLDIGISNTSIFAGRNGFTPTINDYYSQASLPGFKDKNRFQGTELSLRFDDANDPGHPTAGRIGKIAGSFFHDLHGDRQSFWKTSLDFTQHLHLFHDRVLVLRGAGEMTQAAEGHDIPFYHLAEIGSYGTVRGLTRGRFRDNDYVLGSAEYRYPVWIPWAKLVDAVVFVDGGQVAHDVFEDTRFADWQIGYGGGFRFYNATTLIAKTEIAFSQESYRFYFTLNTP